MIGLYGPIFFQSGTTGLCTFNELKKTVTARWGSHEVWLDKPMLEYSGPQLIEVSFTMELIKPFTVDPLTTVFILEEIMDLAVPLPLIIGMKPMGRGASMFVLTSLSSEPKYFYRNGSWLGCSVEVQLKEYPNITPNSLFGALGGILGGIPGVSGALGALSSIPGVSGALGALSGVSGALGVLSTIPGVSGVLSKIPALGTITGILASVPGLGAIAGGLPNNLLAPEIAAVTNTANKVVPSIAQNLPAAGLNTSLVVPTPTPQSNV